MLGDFTLEAFDIPQHLGPHLVVRYAGPFIRARLCNGGFGQLALGFKVGVGLVNGMAYKDSIVCLAPAREILGLYGIDVTEV